MNNEYTIEEVKKHNLLKDLWIIYNKRVFDLSTYADKHPGGVDELLFVAGKDATEDFDDAGHSDEAKLEMEEFFIGTVKEL